MFFFMGAQCDCSQKYERLLQDIVLTSVEIFLSLFLLLMSKCTVKNYNLMNINDNGHPTPHCNTT